MQESAGTVPPLAFVLLDTSLLLHFNKDCVLSILASSTPFGSVQYKLHIKVGAYLLDEYYFNMCVLFYGSRV